VEPGPEAAVVAVSLDAVLWLGLVLIAALMRFVSLDRLPFSEAESARAFAAWAVSEGSVPDNWTGDVTAALTSHLFRIFGSSDTAARIVPAIAGSALVASFWFAGRYAGRGVALLAGALIALSPLAVYTSRSALGFALGGLLSMAMVLSLLAYVERPRQPPAVILFAAFGLALASDPVATGTAIAVVAFLAAEGAWRSGGAVSEAAAAFRSTRDHWQPASLALAAALVLGVVQLGTDIDRVSLPGVREWADMFALPRDGLPWHYQLSTLLTYEWPLLLAGAAGYLLLIDRWLRLGGLSLAQRLLAVWATVAIVTVAFATRRESGQLLLVLLPFSLIAASLVQEVASKTDWSALRRWWPGVVVVLALAAYVVLQLSRWSRFVTPFPGDEKWYTILAFLAGIAVVSGGIYYLQRNAAAFALPLVAAVALPFLVHSSLSLGLRDGAEFAAGNHATGSVAGFRAAVARAAAEAGAPAAVDPGLRDSLGWGLRDVALVFGDPTDGSPIVTKAGGQPPAGYEPLGAPWRISEGWVLDDFDPLPTWRWFVYRKGYGNLRTVDAQILVPSQ
jgi:4-amino-4-deoxy-L-arabinose transferase-like glycosyltransferase